MYSEPVQPEPLRSPRFWMYAFPAPDQRNSPFEVMVPFVLRFPFASMATSTANPACELRKYHPPAYWSKYQLRDADIILVLLSWTYSPVPSLAHVTTPLS